MPKAITKGKNPEIREKSINGKIIEIELGKRDRYRLANGQQDDD